MSRMNHANCEHDTTPAARAKCRRASNVETNTRRVAHVTRKAKAAPTMPFADAVAAIKSRLSTEGYASAYVTSPYDFDSYEPRSIKVFTIDDNGDVDAKEYSGCEMSFNLHNVENFEVM